MTLKRETSGLIVNVETRSGRENILPRLIIEGLLPITYIVLISYYRIFTTSPPVFILIRRRNPLTTKLTTFPPSSEPLGFNDEKHLLHVITEGNSNGESIDGVFSETTVRPFGDTSTSNVVSSLLRLSVVSQDVVGDPLKTNGGEKWTDAQLNTQDGVGVSLTRLYRATY